MFEKKVIFYLGKEKANSYSGVYHEDGLFFVIEIEEGVNETISLKINQYFKKGFQIESLADFDNLIVNLITELNLPSSFSIACGYLKKDNVFYLKTIGQGKIFIKRKDQFGLLLDKDNTASGQVEVDDVYIFTTLTMETLVNGEQGFFQVLKDYSFENLIEEIKLKYEEKDDSGVVCLFLKLKSYENIEEEDEEENQDSDSLIIEERPSLIKTNIKQLILGNLAKIKTNKKIFTFILTLVFFGLFFWSVILGYQRRNNKIYQQKINETYNLISQKLSLAEEVSFLNMARATILFKESQQEYDKLIKDLDKNLEKEKKVIEIKNLIQRAEERIFKKEKAQYEEFYDLAVDEKNISLSGWYLEENNLLLIDKLNARLYILSLAKKSLKKYQNNDFKKGELFALDNEEVYLFIKDKGIYRFFDSKLNKIIDYDKDWKNINDMKFYNGNLYLLDSGADEVWKYSRSGESFSSKSSYFKSGESVDLNLIKSLAIDGAVYLGGDNLVFKYISGIRENFKLDLPDSNFKISKIYTDKNLEKIYLWDKSQGKVYVLGKNGEFIEQIYSDILAKGKDMVVFRDEIYVLEGSRIYKIKN